MGLFPRQPISKGGQQFLEGFVRRHRFVGEHVSGSLGMSQDGGPSG
jgi:hypothetical protein